MLLPAVPVLDRVQDRPAVLPRAQERRPAAGDPVGDHRDHRPRRGLRGQPSFSYDAGTAAGVIAGALTESATIGTASDAIGRLGLPPADAAAIINHIPVAFAVTYLIGVVGAAWFLAQIGPGIMGINLEEECRRYEQEMGGGFVTGATARRDIE